MKIATATIKFQKKVHINYLKVTIINKFLYKLKMVYCDRIDHSEGIDIDKISA